DVWDRKTRIGRKASRQSGSNWDIWAAGTRGTRNARIGRKKEKFTQVFDWDKSTRRKRRARKGEV
ncbi:hypothetical protein KI387_044365, partial [Taxus chinensis]